MKLSSLALCGCLFAAAAPRSTAQYIINTPAGYSLISNRMLMNGCSDGLCTQAGNQVYRWNPVSQSYEVFTDDPLGGGCEWIDPQFNPNAPCLLYGEAFFFYNANAAFPMFVPGTTRVPVLPLTAINPGVIKIVQGYNFLASQKLGVQTFENIVGWPANNFGSVMVFKLDPAGPFLLGVPPGTQLPGFAYYFSGGATGKWSPTPPELNNVGQGCIMYFGAPIPSGSPPACMLSSVAPDRHCRGGAAITLKAYGLGLPANAADIELYRTPGGVINSVGGTFQTLDPGYLYSASFVIPPGTTVGSWNVRFLDPLNQPITSCVLLNGFEVRQVNCNQAQLQVRLVGPNRVAPGVQNRYALYYKNVGGNTANNANFYIHCIPGSPLVTASPVGTPGIPAGVSPCTTGGPKQYRVLNVPSVASGGSGWMVVDLTVGTQPLGNCSYTLAGAAFRNGNQLQHEDSLCVNIVSSQDPNDKVGPAGVGPQHCITGKETLPYEVKCENLASATAPAQRVVITDRLDPAKVDLTSFSLGPMFFGSQVVTPPAGAMSYTTDVPFAVNANPADDIIVRINASLNTIIGDPDLGLITWRFQSIDPVTGLPPTDPLRGFLPPNTTPPMGQGSVFFSVDPHSYLATGDTIANGARIVFDNNPFIDTPVWVNTIDTTAPVLTIQKQGNSAVVTWTGCGTLQSTTELPGQWVDVPNATSPYTEMTAGQKFFQVRQ